MIVVEHYLPAVRHGHWVHYLHLECYPGWPDDDFNGVNRRVSHTLWSQSEDFVSAANEQGGGSP